LGSCFLLLFFLRFLEVALVRLLRTFSGPPGNFFFLVAGFVAIVIVILGVHLGGRP
jgi:hypothetical protein